MEKSETKQILVNVEDILKILQNFTAVAVAAIKYHEESSGTFGDVVFNAIDNNLDIFEDIAAYNQIDVNTKNGLACAFRKFDES